jgi:hypothetical protein
VIRDAITPLRLIFWGGLICLLDIKFKSIRNGYGFQFDLLNDVIGAVMIAMGVFRLAAIRLDADLTADDRTNIARQASYDRGMAFVKPVAVLYVVQAIVEHYVMPLPAPATILVLIWGLAVLAATITFCLCMQQLCAYSQLLQSAASWKTTTVLFIVIFAIPLGLLNVLSIGAVAMGERAHFDLGPLGLIVILVFFVPIIHLFVSTSRMRREVEHGAS